MHPRNRLAWCARPRGLAAVLLALALAGAAPASAAAPGAERAAEEVFHQGREAMKRGDYAAALPLLRESQRLFPTPGTLLNLAVTEQKLGMTASARRHFDEVAGLLPTGDARAAMARKESEDSAARVARLRILPGGGAGTQVTLDDAPLAADRLGTEIPVDPGKHVVTAAAPGGAPSRYEVLALEGRLVELAVGRDPLASSAVPPASSGRRTAGFVTLGVGIAALGVGAVTGIVALGKHGEINNPAGACHAAGTCTAVASSGKALSWASTVTFAVGAAGAATGLYLVLSRPGAARPEKSAALVLAPRAGGGTVALGGAF